MLAITGPDKIVETFYANSPTTFYQKSSYFTITFGEENGQSYLDAKRYFGGERFIKVK